MENQKMVVLDLDNTLWTGILAENPDVVLRPDAERRIKKLVESGIMVSVASKNDFEMAKQKLQEFQLWDYIVCPQINYKGKADNLAAIIQMSHLRPESITFIDDEPLNLAEVNNFFPGIHTCPPDFFDVLLNHPKYQGKPDLSMNRLKQFRILEQKAQDINTEVNKEAFLRKCHIVVTLQHTALHWDRIQELGDRTRQLNYTRQKLDVEYLTAMQQQGAMQLGELWVKDRYGDYGLSGFYALNLETNTL